jgi:hypothetical protein
MRLEMSGGLVTNSGAPGVVRGAVWRPARFAAGVLAGFVSAAVAALATLLVVSLRYDELMSGDVDLRISGRDVSAGGGTKVAIRRATGVIVLSCNDACDDLHVANDQRSNALLDIRVLDRNARCVACVTGADGIRKGQRDEWAISGASRVGVAHARRADGRHG